MTDTADPVGQGDTIVEAGDSMVSIAAKSGHLPDTIWTDPANDALKTARKDGEVLMPGDRVTVPALRVKSEARATGKRHVFRRKGLTVKVTLYVQDDEGEAFASKKYELTIDGQTISGTTDDAGKIECTIAPQSRSGTLSVWLDEPGLPNPWVREVSLAELYPIEHPIGVQQRLANLGYYSGNIDGEVGPATMAAVAAFAVAQSLPASDTIDDAFRAKLVEVHKV